MAAEQALQAERELDPAVLRRAQQGSVPDRQLLVRTYERQVFALIGRMLVPRGRGGLVRDLAQEAFVRVLRSLPRFELAGPARLSTWILTIATRAVLDELRRPRLVEEPLERAAEVPDGEGDRMPDRVALRAALMSALRDLEPSHQAVLLLRDGHDLDYQDIAEALGINVGTVKSRLSRARAALREALERKGGAP
jgi:RNA polymerase sigma-70 factor, ECF subfamily